MCEKRNIQTKTTPRALQCFVRSFVLELCVCFSCVFFLGVSGKCALQRIMRHDERMHKHFAVLKHNKKTETPFHFLLNINLNDESFRVIENLTYIPRQLISKSIWCVYVAGLKVLCKKFSMEVLCKKNFPFFNAHDTYRERERKWGRSGAPSKHKTN